MASKAIYITTSGSMRRRAGFPESYSTTNLLRLKRGDKTLIRVGFLTENGSFDTVNGAGSTPEEAASTFVQFGIKEIGKYDATQFIASGSVVGMNSEGFYDIEVNLNTEALNALLLTGDGNTTNDEVEVELMFEITWSIGGGGSGSSDWRSTNLAYCVIENDVIKLNEAEALASAQGVVWQWGFDEATKIPSRTPLVLVDQASEPYASAGVGILVTSATYGLSSFQVAKLNKGVNGKAAYGTGQPTVVSPLPSSPKKISDKSVHCWWDGEYWNLHIYDEDSWVAGWSSDEDVADPSLVTSWVAIIATYPLMTDDLGSVSIATSNLEIILPSSSVWSVNGLQVEFTVKDSGGETLTVVREDSSFTIDGGSSVTIAQGGSSRYVLNANAAVPNWVLLNYDQDVSGDVGWIP